MTSYAGNPANFPTSYPLLADHTTPTASSIDPALEALGDRTAWLRAMLGGVAPSVVTASGSYVVPPQCGMLLVVGYGGGGAGGSGNTGASGPLDRLLSGGGGGGGSMESIRLVAVTPGETIDVLIGAGGDPVLTGLGGSSRLQRSGVDIAVFAGGGAGSNARTVPVAAGDYFPFASGGTPSPVGYSVNPLNWRSQGILCPVIDGQVTIPPILSPGCGGYGTCDDDTYRAALAGTGAGATSGFAGGATGGTRGVDSVLCRGGGSGGGGGAGPGGSGGAGGKGGAGSTASTSGASGANGIAAAPNTGAGGGGGGSGGQGTDGSRGAAGTGGAGGSGKVTIYAIKMGDL